MLRQTILRAALLTAILTAAPVVHARTLELALVIDGSSSISPTEFALQIGAYQSIFTDNFYDRVPGDTDLHVAAYLFSGVVAVPGGGGTPLVFSVFDWIPWTQIDSNAAAAGFGDAFQDFIQPAGATSTAAALAIAASGGDIGCPAGGGAPPFCVGISTVTGIDNNGIDGDEFVIDLSTDGLPFLPLPDNTEQQNADLARAEALATADAIRDEGIVINAIGVGLGGLEGLSFLSAVTGVDPADTPQGFFLTTDDFTGFGSALQDKLGTEVGVIPLPATLPLFLSALAGAACWRRRRN